MPVRSAALGALLFSFIAATATGCATSAEGDDATAGSESALTSAPRGHFNLVREPFSQSFIRSATFEADGRVALEYVRVRTGSSPFPLDPFGLGASTTRETFSLRGKALTFTSSGATQLALEVGEPFGSLIYKLDVNGDVLRLQAIGEPAFELKAGPAVTVPTAKRVVRCEGRKFGATITLDEAQRRRGTMTVKAHPDADRTDPPSGTFPILFTGNTGVRDAMAYEGTDDRNNDYDMALFASELERTTGPISNVGVGFARSGVGFGVHYSLACTIGAD